MSKFKFTGETLNHKGRIVKQIVSTEKTDVVNEGEVGGYIEFPHNLDEHSNAWVADNAIVYGASVVSGDALIKDNAEVKSSYVSGETLVCDHAYVINSTVVDSTLGGYISVRNSKALKNSQLSDLVQLSNDTEAVNVVAKGYVILADGKVHENIHYLNDEVFFENMHM